MWNFLKQFRYFDLPLLIIMLLVGAGGLALIYSSSISLDGSAGGFWRQAVFFAVGLLGYLFLSFYDYHSLAKQNRLIYLALVAVLAYLLIFGSIIRGGRRWIDLSFFRLQPAEFAKLIIILGLARLLYLKRGQINSVKQLILSFIYVLIPMLLILVEPDLGSAIVLLALWIGILLISPIQKKYLLAIFLGFALVSGVAWKFFLKDFQRDRILVFLNPELDPRGRGYNVRQATIAVGSGQIFGSGLGKGLQTQNKFLPEQQTDFAFAAAAEQVGFVGTGALLGLYLFMLGRLLLVAKRAKDDLGMYLAAGVFFLIFCHVVINAGMNLGLLPVTGIPLPLISAGGSSMLVTFLALGVAQNVSLQSKALRF
ncbi:MAG: rod shape-determining protein RodA [Patescibacteria group bacterium]|nr:rod shape-determining protein RodA [Patescibacteria group bacterium]